VLLLLLGIPIRIPNCVGGFLSGPRFFHHILFSIAPDSSVAATVKQGMDSMGD